MKVIAIKKSEFNVYCTTEDIFEQLLHENRFDFEDQFDEMIDDSTEPIELFGIEYPASTALKNIDQYRYNEAVDEYIHDLALNYGDELESYGEVDVFNVKYKIVED